MGMWHAINLLKALVKSPSQANLALDWPLSGENAHKSSGANYLMTNQSPPELGNFTYLAFQTPYEVFSKPSIRKRSVFVWIILGHQCCHILASKGQQNIFPAGMPLEKFANIVHLSTVDHPKIFFCVVLLHLLQGKLRKFHFSNAPLLFACPCTFDVFNVTKSKVCLQVPRGPFVREDWGKLCQQSAATPMDCMISIEVSWFSTKPILFFFEFDRFSPSLEENVPCLHQDGSQLDCKGFTTDVRGFLCGEIRTHLCPFLVYRSTWRPNLVVCECWDESGDHRYFQIHIMMEIRSAAFYIMVVSWTT